MKKKRTLEQLLRDFFNVHGDSYSYEHVNDSNYKNTKSKIPVVCKKHGMFSIIVGNHLIGQGCPRCAKIKRRLSNIGNVRKRQKLVYGVGINDYDGNIKFNHKHIPSYHNWVSMLKRAYSIGFKKTNHTYIECSVCKEWLSFFNFKKWFDKNYVDGYCLDKDILFKGNKLYSPSTCCFVPPEINVLLCKTDKKRGNMPIGVYERATTHGFKYVSYCNKYGKHIHLGTYPTPQLAFQAYKRTKEAHIQEMATRYFQDGKITKKVYNALMNYNVEIND